MLRQYLVLGHHAAEELVEQWDGERCVTVGRAVDHPLLDENRSPGRNALDANTELGGDVSATLAGIVESPAKFVKATNLDHVLASPMECRHA